MNNIHITKDDDVELRDIDTYGRGSIEDIIQKEVKIIYLARLGIAEFISAHGESAVKAAFYKIMQEKITLARCCELYKADLKETRQAYKLVKKAAITNIEFSGKELYCLCEKEFGWWHLSRKHHPKSHSPMIMEILKNIEGTGKKIYAISSIKINNSYHSRDEGDNWEDNED